MGLSNVIMKNYNEELNKLKENFEALDKSDFLSWEQIKQLKGIIGVYVIFFENKIIYVGKTNNFNVRFGTNLMDKSTHTLHRKLLREKSLEEVRDFIKQKCRYKIKECNDVIEAEELESFVISVFEPSYNNHFYKKPE